LGNRICNIIAGFAISENNRALSSDLTMSAYGLLRECQQNRGFTRICVGCVAYSCQSGSFSIRD
jgi:hypothetical protein